ncbi:DUF4139 domain-containing protein [uncultured Pseudodesulfovibrio sp.]|uniref:DUF4139 domain-containing protein n=1 Tax=uncultured Pseudodesulfovibrio sp. TaxID=2035858 RepID=UPI0029C82F0A|nr:DUF4139 domain-containing protein [uncultured Pseudodesulfovibrio sp.]
MNRLKSRALSLLTLLFALCFSLPVFAGSVSGASVTVYNSGRALVKETRSATLPQGMASVVFKNIPATIDPTSVRASAKGMQVLGVQYDYLPISPNNLLERYVGKELTVILPDPTDANARTLRKATLLSMSKQQGPVFLVGKEVYVGAYEALLLPELPADLQREPTLTLTTKNQTASKRDVRLSYLMGGLTWRADYTLSVNRAGDEAVLDAWATLDNSSGRGFSNASLKLVAGQVQRETGGRMLRKANVASMEYAMADAAPQPREEAFSQFHVYSVPGYVNLTEHGTRQTSLFAASGIKVKQQLVSRYHAGAGQQGGPVKQNVQASLTFANSEKNSLGNPMPSGLVRVFMPASDGDMLLAGESSIGHVGPGGEVKLTLGQAFDVTVERSQTSFRKLGKNSFEMSWSLSVVNGKKTPQELRLTDFYSGQWNIVKADRKYSKPDARSVQFDLTVPPTAGKKPMVVNYTVQVTY